MSVNLGCSRIFTCIFSQGDSGMVGNFSKMFIEIPNDSEVGTIPEVLFAMFR